MIFYLLVSINSDIIVRLKSKYVLCSYSVLFFIEVNGVYKCLLFLGIVGFVLLFYNGLFCKF